MTIHRSQLTAAAVALLLGGVMGAIAPTAWANSPLGQLAQGQRGNAEGRAHRGLATAAERLGVSEADLKAALGLPAERPSRPDMAAVAAQLGVSEADLTTALRESYRSAMQAARAQGQGRQAMAQGLRDAATRLGVGEADLRAALGIPDTMPQRPDMATAAAQLGVSEADLRAALQEAMPRRGQRGQRETTR